MKVLNRNQQFTMDLFDAWRSCPNSLAVRGICTCGLHAHEFGGLVGTGDQSGRHRARQRTLVLSVCPSLQTDRFASCTPCGPRSAESFVIFSISPMGRSSVVTMSASLPTV